MKLKTFFENLSLKRSGQAPGSQFNGLSLKTILKEDSLEMMDGILPVNGHAFISYFRSLKEVHRICLAQEIDPEYRKIITDFENIFNLMYDTFQLNMTLKIHVIIHHYADYFELSGLTFRDTNGEFNEAMHSTLGERLGFKVVKKMETIFQQNKGLQSLSTFNNKRD